ncbi:hypothetical protein L227DRAFT_618087 [Lentinus tigrinus ALCF2SS1-6]|uniref:Uncharacterized protein n=1 Tax=Lentinus tigrinus ALCF2SS1-6 TaxID=1328759 RepID=A0A5C2RKG2_9APHY|nr:hypothetical protein L227DRAFT_618087 [Lentinus tigrinus ALCF2SS1-6]
MAFNGIIFLNGPPKIRRPKDYGGPNIMAPNMHVPPSFPPTYQRILQAKSWVPMLHAQTGIRVRSTK